MLNDENAEHMPVLWTLRQLPGASARSSAKARQLEATSSQSIKLCSLLIGPLKNNAPRQPKLFADNSTPRPNVVADLQVAKGPSSGAMATPSCRTASICNALLLLG